jgi:hypothetical protein
MKWYKHDSNASCDAKLRKVRLKYGMEGYGLYWYCLELVAQNVEAHNLTFELEHDAEIIAADTGIHYELVQEMMTYMVDLGLFEQSDGVITCFKLAKRCDEYTSKLIRNLPSVPTVSGQSPDKVPPIRIEQNRIEQNRIEHRAAKRCPTTYQPHPDLIDSLAEETGISQLDVLALVNEMKDHEFKAAKKDWDAVFRNWVRRSVKWVKKTSDQPTDPYYENLRKGLANVGD